MSVYLKALKPFVDLLVEKGDFTVAGVEAAFDAFSKSLSVKEYKPIVVTDSSSEKTTLKEAAEKAKLPIYLTVEKNSEGNFESTVYRGLVFKEAEGGVWVAFGLQDGKNIVPLTMNAVYACRANGWRYNSNNLVGSAAETKSELRVVL